METYTNVYIGIVDILGYTDNEKRLDKLGKQPSAEILSMLFRFLDSLIKGFNDSHITWIRYGDGYVFYSHEEKIDNLSKIIKACCRIISMALIDSIPLRIAITQGDIKIDNLPQGGTTVSGTGWGEFKKLEKALNWMGGFLYIPTYNGTHYSTVQNLIQTTHLVIQQNYTPNNQHFKAPFKKGMETNKERTWFLNWHKLLHESKNKVEQEIGYWWGKYVRDNSINNSKDVKEKQKNSIDFVDYCLLLYEAANLIYHSEIDKRINIKEINNIC